MIKIFPPVFFFILTAGCDQHKTGQPTPVEKEQDHNFVIHSRNVGDSFTVFVDLPHGYDPRQPKRYPVVYALDANFYFDMESVILHKYSGVDLAPEVILVGIGYKDFPTMDSLRDRDYTYPVANPEYEMTVSGGAAKFLSFISEELVPLIDKEYRTDTARRVLWGHSLGGYFSAYTLWQNLSGRNSSFTDYIAVSPSLNYNKYYLLNRFGELLQQAGMSKKIKAYFSFGGLEEAEEDEPGLLKQKEVSEKLEQLFKRQSARLEYKEDLFSNLSHMDTPIPAFIKGLQWMMGRPE